MEKINDIPILKCETSPLTLATPELSTHFIDEYKYKFNRRMGLKKIRDMRRAMELGVFPITDGYFCTSLDTGKCDMIDLFHRCTVSRDYKQTFKVFIHDLWVETEEQKKALWWSIDGDDRDLADYFSALGAAEHGLGITDLTYLSTACSYLENRFSQQFLENHRTVHLVITERLAIAEQFLRPAGLYFKSIRGAHPDVRGVLRSGYNVALGCVFFDVAPEIAAPFYTSIAKNNGLTTGDPRHTFRKELVKTGIVKSGLLEHLQRLTYCWNSHVLREDRQNYNKLGKEIVVPIRLSEYQIGG